MKKVVVLFLIFFILPAWRWGRGISNSQLKEEYENHFLVRDAKDTKGNLYRTPKLYGGTEVPIEESVNGGKSWQEIGKVSVSLTYSAWGSALFVNKKDNFYFVCSSRSIQFSKSADYGRRWSTAITIPGSKGYNPKIFVDSQGTTYVVWYQSVRGQIVRDIYLSVSQNGGRDWKTERLRQGSSISFTESDNTVYLSYVKEKTLYFSYTRDRGKTWHTETFGFLVPMKDPYVKVYRGKVYLLFQGYKPDLLNIVPSSRVKYNLFLTTSGDMGKTWKGLERLTNN